MSFVVSTFCSHCRHQRILFIISSINKPFLAEQCKICDTVINISTILVQIYQCQRKVYRFHEPHIIHKILHSQKFQDNKTTKN